MNNENISRNMFGIIFNAILFVVSLFLALSSLGRELKSYNLGNVDVNYMHGALLGSAMFVIPPFFALIAFITNYEKYLYSVAIIVNYLPMVVFVGFIIIILFTDMKFVEIVLLSVGLAFISLPLIANIMTLRKQKSRIFEYKS